MLQPGATPLNRFFIPETLPVADITELSVVYGQNEKLLIRKVIDDVEKDIAQNAIVVNLTQDDSLKIVNCRAVEIQMKIKINGNTYVSDIIRESVGRVLDKEVL